MYTASKLFFFFSPTVHASNSRRNEKRKIILQYRKPNRQLACAYNFIFYDKPNKIGIFCFFFFVDKKIRFTYRFGCRDEKYLRLLTIVEIFNVNDHIVHGVCEKR